MQVRLQQRKEENDWEGKSWGLEKDLVWDERGSFGDRAGRGDWALQSMGSFPEGTTGAKGRLPIRWVYSALAPVHGCSAGERGTQEPLSDTFAPAQAEMPRKKSRHRR